MKAKPIYLDYQATTPMDPRVLEAMLPFFRESFGNPASTIHIYGWEANAAVERSRQTIAEAIAAAPEEIVFTSGATEANNLTIKGIAEAYCHQGRHLITVQTEHRSILDPCQYLQSLGFDVTLLPVQPDGLLEVKDLAQAIRPDTILVSVMAANNEIGVLQPLTEIGQLCHERHILFHTDAAQALGKIPLNVEQMHLDLMSFSAHKLYGPKGIGALYVRRRQPRVQLAAQVHGGGQERGRRSGTLSPPLIVGFARAVALAIADLTTEIPRQTQLRNQLWTCLQSVGNIHLNGHPTQRLGGNLNVSIEQVEGMTLLAQLRNIAAVSSGSACASNAAKPSHVLKALGRSEALARASIRFGLGRFTTAAEIDQVTQATLPLIATLRKTTAEVTEAKC